MNTNEAEHFLYTDEGAAVEMRYQRAKQALLDAQQRHCDAAHELLLARAQVRQLLEAVFPGAEAAPGQPNSGMRGGCTTEMAVSAEMAAGRHYMGARP